MNSFTLTLLKLALVIISWMKQNQSLEAGRDQEIARAALAVLEATEYGKQLREAVAEMSDEEAEGLWDRMVPK